MSTHFRGEAVLSWVGSCRHAFVVEVNTLYAILTTFSYGKPGSPTSDVYRKIWLLNYFQDGLIFLEISCLFFYASLCSI